MVSSAPLSSLLGIGSPASGQAGASLVETMVGTAIAAFGLIGLYVTSSQCIGTTRAHREILTAEHCLEQRTEQYCSATWTQLTTTAGVQALLNVTPVNDASLANHTETVTVTAYPAVSPDPHPISVTRDATGNTSVTSSPTGSFNMQNSISVRIDFREAWNSAQGGRSRSRETSTVIANGGLQLQ